MRGLGFERVTNTTKATSAHLQGRDTRRRLAAGASGTDVLQV